MDTRTVAGDGTGKVVCPIQPFGMDGEAVRDMR